jgi:hypothetical protein
MRNVFKYLFQSKGTFRADFEWEIAIRKMAIWKEGIHEAKTQQNPHEYGDLHLL